MRAIVVRKQGTPVSGNVALVEDWPEPEPGPGEAVVRTEASALNHLDLWVGRGLPGLDLEYPRIGGSDGAGVVESVGAGVDERWVGRRVLLNAAVSRREPVVPGRMPTGVPEIVMIGEHVNGAHAGKFKAPVSNLMAIDHCDAVTAVGAGLTFLTAWRMLITRARLRPGQWVLITGIGGGVALALLKIAVQQGCRTIVTSRHEWKLERARDLGAEYGVLDGGEDWSREVRRITEKRGVDVCADSVGKAIHLSCVKSLARGGTFVTCGTTTGPGATTDLARMFWNQLTFVGSTMGDMDEFREVFSLVLSGRLDPEIDRVYEPEAASEAYERLEKGEQFGKIVVRW